MATGSNFRLNNIENILHVSTLALGIGVKLECGPAFYIPQRDSISTDVIEIVQANRVCLEPNLDQTEWKLYIVLYFVYYNL